MNKRLFHSLAQQLKHKVFFITDVGKPYYDSENELKILDFNYKGQECHLLLNGSIKLKTQQHEKEIGSYQELVNGLRHSVANPRVNT